MQQELEGVSYLHFTLTLSTGESKYLTAMTFWEAFSYDCKDPPNPKGEQTCTPNAFS